jgi:DNA repair protein RadC
MKILEMPLENRPRERLKLKGSQALSDSELLALIFQKGTKNNNVIEMSNELINKYGISKLSELSMNELMQIKGIKSAKACQLIALFEIAKRCNIKKSNIKSIKSAKDVYELVKERYCDYSKEVFGAIYLNTKNKVLKEEIITIGLLDASPVHPREVFRGAIREGAKSLIIIHNHPSGDSSPSKDDLQITESLMNASEIISIPLLDHVIIGKNNYWSYAENN